MQSQLGIGLNSSFLTALLDAEIVPTRNLGFWAGSRSTTEPIDGSLHIGGYDSGRVDGDLMAFPMWNNCDTCVHIENITYSTSANSSTIFFGNTSDTYMWVALNPFNNRFELQPNVFRNFLDISGSFADSDTLTTGLLKTSRDIELGDLHVTLRGGYRTIIPARELFSPPRDFTTDGTYSILNDSYLIPTVINRTIASEYALTWGLPFFSANYLVMDFDWQTMKLAPAKQGLLKDNERSSIMPLCKPSASHTATATATPLIPDGSKKETNTGAITGGVIGGLLGLAILLLLSWYVLRRRKQRKHIEQEKYQAVPVITNILER